MKASDKINIGDLVMVAYPTGEQTNNPAHELDGQQYSFLTDELIRI